MHDILDGQQASSDVAGFQTETDFVETLANAGRNFRDPAILRSFAKHYQTNEVLPLDLIDRMNRAGAFRRASWYRDSFSTRHTRSMSTTIHRTHSISIAMMRTDYTRFYPCSTSMAIACMPASPA